MYGGEKTRLVNDSLDCSMKWVISGTLKKEFKKINAKNVKKTRRFNPGYAQVGNAMFA